MTPRRTRPEREHVSPVSYIALGLVLGFAYAVMNSLTDTLVHDEPLVHGVGLLHGFVDHGIPLAVGAILGMMAYGLHAGARRSRERGKRTDPLGVRLTHVELSTLDLGAVVREVADDLRPLALQSGVRLRVHAHESVRALADPLFVRSILENLLGIGIDVLRGKGPAAAVDVEVRSDGQEALVLVRDIGPGLDEQVRETVFDPLGSTKEHGLGVGLPISRVLARAMRGDLELETVDGEPTTFAVRLPVNAASRADQ